MFWGFLKARALVSVAVKCSGKVFFNLAAPERTSFICSTWCLLVKLNLVEWEEVRIVIITFKLQLSIRGCTIDYFAMLFEVCDIIRQMGCVTEGGRSSSCPTACLHANLLQGEFCFAGKCPYC